MNDHDRIMKRIMMRKAKRAALMNELRRLSNEADVSFMAPVGCPPVDPQPAELEPLLWPNGQIPVCMEIRDYYGKLCHRYRPGPKPRLARRRRRQ